MLREITPPVAVIPIASATTGPASPSCTNPNVRGGIGAPGKINLYVGREPVRFNIPEVEAVESLVDLIREHDKWVEPVGETISA